MLISASELTAVPGKSGQLGPLVAEMRDVLSKESGKTWYAWGAMTGRPYGTYVLSTRFDDYADLITSQMKGVMSENWAAVASKAEGVLDHPAPSMLNEVVAVAGEPAAPKQFAIITRAVADRANLMAAVGWAGEVAEYVAKSTGIAVTVATAAAGQMFVVSWLSGVDSPEEVDKLNSIGTDPGYLELIGAAGPLFEQGSSERMLLVRLP